MSQPTKPAADPTTQGEVKWKHPQMNMAVPGSSPRIGKHNPPLDGVPTAKDQAELETPLRLVTERNQEQNQEASQYTADTGINPQQSQSLAGAYAPPTDEVSPDDEWLERAQVYLQNPLTRKRLLNLAISFIRDPLTAMPVTVSSGIEQTCDLIFDSGLLTALVGLHMVKPEWSWQRAADVIGVSAALTAYLGVMDRVGIDAAQTQQDRQEAEGATLDATIIGPGGAVSLEDFEYDEGDDREPVYVPETAPPLPEGVRKMQEAEAKAQNDAMVAAQANWTDEEEEEADGASDQKFKVAYPTKKKHKARRSK